MGEAVAEVQCRRVIALAEAAPCAACCFQVFDGDRNQLDLAVSRSVSSARAAVSPPRRSNTMDASGTFATDMRHAEAAMIAPA